MPGLHHIPQPRRRHITDADPHDLDIEDLRIRRLWDSFAVRTVHGLTLATGGSLPPGTVLAYPGRHTRRRLFFDRARLTPVARVTRTTRSGRTLWRVELPDGPVTRIVDGLADEHAAIRTVLDHARRL